jgi:hypothetical protein
LILPVLWRFEYDLLATFLVEKRGYDPTIKHKDFDSDSHLICKVGPTHSSAHRSDMYSVKLAPPSVLVI